MVCCSAAAGWYGPTSLASSSSVHVFEFKQAQVVGGCLWKVCEESVHSDVFDEEGVLVVRVLAVVPGQVHVLVPQHPGMHLHRSRLVHHRHKLLSVLDAAFVDVAGGGVAGDDDVLIRGHGKGVSADLPDPLRRHQVLVGPPRVLLNLVRLTNQLNELQRGLGVYILQVLSLKGLEVEVALARVVPVSLQSSQNDVLEPLPLPVRHLPILLQRIVPSRRLHLRIKAGGLGLPLGPLGFAWEVREPKVVVQQLEVPGH
mmetsp:Transcript_13552/g.34076  ORF Transcript_13552/g.34076 Transcript_13552/m.34076 type:complete len:257 (+) Transcript_13552:56-826(+)